MTAFTCVPLAIVWPCARWVEAITSSSSSAADARGHGLLTDCDVQEPRQLARAEALLHLLLEADEQSLRKSSCTRSAESPCAASALSSTFAIGPRSAPDGMGLAEQQVRSGPTCLRLGREEARPLDLAARPSPRAATLLGPASPGRVGDHLRVSVFRAGGGIGPDQAEKLFRKLDEERIRGTVSLVTVAEREERQARPGAGRRALGSGRDRARGTGAICWPRSIWPRATTSRAPRCCSRR